MANLYEYKDSNIRKTWLLFTFFLIFIIALGFIISRAMGTNAVLIVAVVFSSSMSIISYWYSDKIVLRLAGAREIKKQDAPELYRIIENLSITAGLPTPKVFIIQDAAPNAFATGRDAEHAVVAVTTGLLDVLEKPELEGVIGHELSHIGNRDMLISTVVVVLVGFVALLSDFFLRSLWFRGFGGRSDRSQVGGIFLLIGIILAILSPLIATLIQLAISRRREFLADTSSALLTRYPEGLISALRKIDRSPHQLRRASSATAHMYIANPFKGGDALHGLHKLFLTHPPVEERVKSLQGLKI
ncbi:zinc metalloprotease HtpX [Candidatus Parcubacteria bacterium]|nr:MAG: zinc metalloprotease HtpX [Candidatus Parcubacteria bacterium]